MVPHIVLVVPVVLDGTNSPVVLYGLRSLPHFPLVRPLGLLWDHATRCMVPYEGRVLTGLVAPIGPVGLLGSLGRG